MNEPRHIFQTFELDLDLVAAADWNFDRIRRITVRDRRCWGALAFRSPDLPFVDLRVAFNGFLFGDGRPIVRYENGYQGSGTNIIALPNASPLRWRHYRPSYAEINACVRTFMTSAVLAPIVVPAWLSELIQNAEDLQQCQA